MAADDWSAELTDPAPLRAVLGSPPPPLVDYELRSVLVDEREASVTLRFFAFGLPAGAAELWRERGHNAVGFTLVCAGVRNFEVTSWSGYPTTVMTLTGKHVLLAGREKHVTFDATEIHAGTPKGWPASRSE